jgi:hypothetical protein
VVPCSACAVKICKKHDKISRDVKKSSAFVIPVVHNSVFWQSHGRVVDLMNETEHFYVDTFAGGAEASADKKKSAVVKLRGDPHSMSHLVTFRVGLCVGFSAALMIGILLVWFYMPQVAHQPLFRSAFPVFRYGVR